jgi:hypothetical protein
MRCESGLWASVTGGRLAGIVVDLAVVVDRDGSAARDGDGRGVVI